MNNHVLKERLYQLGDHPFSMGGMLGLGLTLRVFLLAFLWPEVLIGDSTFFLEDAARILNGQPLDGYWPPALAYILAFFLSLGFSSTGAGVSASLLFGLLLHVVWEKLGQFYLTRIQRNLGHLLWAVYPAFVYQSLVIQSYLPATVLFLTIVWMLHLQGKLISLLAGVLMGMLVLLRPGFLAMLPVLVWLSWKRKLPWGGWMLGLIPMALLIGWWSIQIHEDTGRWVRINDASAYNLYLGNNPWTPSLRSWWLGSHDVSDDPAFAGFVAERDSLQNLPADQRQRGYTKRVVSHVSDAPFTFLGRVGIRFANFWGFDSLAGGSLFLHHQVLGLLALGGDILCFGWLMWIFSRGMGRASKEVRLFALNMIFFFMVPYLIAFAHPSYHLPLLPLLLMMGLGVKKSKEQKNRKMTYFLVIGIFLLIQLLWIGQLIMR
ncbi:MAG: hypothetical protein AAF135_26395 [Bacteroidota bacterium]